MEQKYFSELVDDKIENRKLVKVSKKTGIAASKISTLRNSGPKTPISFKNGVKLMQVLNIKANQIKLEE